MCRHNFHIHPNDQRSFNVSWFLSIFFSHLIFSLQPLNRSSAPKKDIYYPSEPIEAECKVTGMPTPQVEWVHNSGSIDVSIFIHENFLGRLIHEYKLSRSQNHDFDSNTIMERSPSGIATVVAKLIIKPHHVKPGTSRTYTCVGRSGMKVVKATSKLT